MPSINPNTKATSKDGIFGLPSTEDNAKVVHIPVPWDATASYKDGSHKGPKEILKASDQLDLYDLEYGDTWQEGLFMQDRPYVIKSLNSETRDLALKIIEANEDEVKEDAKLQKTLKQINQASDELNTWVEKECQGLLESNKIPVIVGGDHSTSYGAIAAYAEQYDNFAILHIDAHSDTRKAYMGFEHSHASIMYNVSNNIPQVQKIVQVGVRDFCQEEFDYTTNNPKFKVFYDKDIQYQKLQGFAFDKTAATIINELPEKVYISFDIDGLDPTLCPNTGTPVPGGLLYQEFLYLLNTLVQSKKTIIGFDLVEVAPGKNTDWDGNIGMRLLYKLTAACLASQNK